MLKLRVGLFPFLCAAALLIPCSGHTSDIELLDSAELDALADRLESEGADSSPHRKLAVEDIRRWQARPEGVVPGSRKPETPPGSPIGDPALRWVNWDSSLSSGQWGNYDWWWWE